MRFGHPQKDIKHTGGNVVKNSGVMLKPKLYDAHASEAAPGAVSMAEVALRRPSWYFSRVKEKEHSRKSLGSSAQRRKKTQILQHNQRMWKTVARKRGRLCERKLPTMGLVRH